LGDAFKRSTTAVCSLHNSGDAFLKALTLLLLALPLAACATSPGSQSAQYASCAPRSHWEMTTHCGAFSAYGGAYARANSTSGRARNEPGPTNAAGGIGRGEIYSQ